MKNLFIGLGVLAMIGATSCKKYHTCECKVTVAGITSTSSVTSDTKMTKKDAKADCEGSASTTASSASCELK